MPSLSFTGRVMAFNTEQQGQIVGILPLDNSAALLSQLVGGNVDVAVDFGRLQFQQTPQQAPRQEQRPEEVEQEEPEVEAEPLEEDES